MMITLQNDFHNTARRVMISHDLETLTPTRVRAIRRDLCPSAECTCSGTLGFRGPQPGSKGMAFDTDYPDGSALVFKFVSVPDSPGENQDATDEEDYALMGY